MRYREAVDYLLSRRRFGMKLGLENMKAAMERLGSPQRDMAAVAVAGSKGKGSFGAMLESVLLAARYPAGLYTSPHLLSPRERLRVDGRPVSPKAFAELATEVRRALEPDGPPLTYFEMMTAMAIAHFRRKKALPCIFEVGLGGRLDATNIVPSSLAVVTEIEREHTEFLGTRLGDIAREKGGVLKEGGTLVSGAGATAAKRALAQVARSRSARHRSLSDEAIWHVRAHSRRGLAIDLRAGDEEYRALRVGLAGRHQARNAALTLMAVQELRRGGLNIGKRDFRRGMAAARWPGRNDYRHGRPAFFLDGAHTPSSAAALAATVGELFAGRRMVLLFGILEDKKAGSIAGILFPLFDRVVLVRPPEGRALEPSAVYRLLPRGLGQRCTVAPDLGDGLERAESAAGKRGLVVTAGSLFLVAAVMARKGFAGP